MCSVWTVRTEGWATLPRAEEVGSEMCAQKLATGWCQASAGQPDQDVWGQRPAGGGGRQEPDHGCREHLRDRGAFFSPLRGAEPQQSQQEGEKSAWGAGRAAAAPHSTAGWVAEELAGAARGGGQAALAPCRGSCPW